ncbi:MAG TPA: hypothetical protein PKY91_10300, partial [Rhodocyclaceae bacterium]|nr:hypothetical protein [Rhodocyclaceae bacterium]
MITITNNTLGPDWESFVDHIDGYSIIETTASTISLLLVSSEDDPPTPQGGRLILQGVFSGDPPVGIVTGLDAYLAGETLPAFSVTGLDLTYEAFVGLITLGDLEDY